jgi:peptidoglycan/LPS O-acetylase OafA/YrhL
MRGMTNAVFAFIVGCGVFAATWGESRWGWNSAAVIAVSFLIALVARQWLRLRQAKREGRGIYVNLAGPGNRDA